jgi:hypothetical protein
MGLFTSSWQGETIKTPQELQRAFQGHVAEFGMFKRAALGNPQWGPLADHAGGIFADVNARPTWSGRVTVRKGDAPAYCDVVIYDLGETRNVIIDSGGAPKAAGAAKGVAKELRKLV